MQEKLQEITDKLYQEGLAKGKEEGERVLAKANQEAERMIEEARKESARIVEEAEKKSKDIQARTEIEIQKSGKNLVQQIKQQIEQAVVAQTMVASTRSAMEQTEFVKELLMAAVQSFNAKETAQTLEVLLPEAKQAEFEKFLKEGMGKLFETGMEVKVSTRFNTGFKIKSKDQGYIISFTDEDFIALFTEYLTPKLQEILF